MDRRNGTVGQLAIDIADFQRVAGHYRPVTFFEVGDLISHRGQCNSVRAHEHFADPVADCQG